MHHIWNWLIKLDRKSKIIIAASSVVVIVAIVTVLLIVSQGRESEEKKQPRVISLSIDVPSDIPVEEKEKIVYRSLLAAGFSQAGACGMLGNIAVETTDFDPTVINETNGAFGLFQWTDVGDRQQKLKDFCKDHAMNYGSVEGQIAFAVYDEWKLEDHIRKGETNA